MLRCRFCDARDCLNAADAAGDIEACEAIEAEWTDDDDGWWHDRRFWDWNGGVYREQMLKAHYPYSCGAMFEESGYWYPIEYVARLRADGEELVDEPLARALRNSAPSQSDIPAVVSMAVAASSIEVASALGV